MSRVLPEPDPADLDLAVVLTALGDPTRLAMSRDVFARGRPVECSELVGMVSVTPSTASHHFKALREAGVTHTVITGRTRSITIRTDDLDARFPGLINAVLTSPESNDA